MSNKNKLLELTKAKIKTSKVKLSNGEHVLVRGFTVKEMKGYSEATKENSAAFLDLLTSCLDNKVNAKHLPSHDVERLFIEVYRLTKGNSLVPVKYNCHNEVDGVICGGVIDELFDVQNVQVIDHMPKEIELNDGIKLIMRYPTSLELEFFGEEFKDIINLAMRCVEAVDTGTEILKVGVDLEHEELIEVMDYMTANSIEKLGEFLQAIPTVTTAFPLKCPKCGHTEVIQLTGLLDLFLSC